MLWPQQSFPHRCVVTPTSGLQLLCDHPQLPPAHQHHQCGYVPVGGPVNAGSIVPTDDSIRPSQLRVGERQTCSQSTGVQDQAATRQHHSCVMTDSTAAALGDIAHNDVVVCWYQLFHADYSK